MMKRMLRDSKGFAYFRIPMIISNVTSQTAKDAGLMEKDRVVSVNGVRTETFSDVSGELSENKNKTIPIDVIRKGRLLTIDVYVILEGYLGVHVYNNIINIFETVTVRYDFFGSFPAGVRFGVNTLKGYVGDMKHVFTKEGAKSIGGFGAIGNLFPETWNWHIFWKQTAFLSIILAFMNILPIPALDGGHVMFLLYEVVTRRKPGDKFLEYAQIAGMALLILLVLYANGNDVFRFFFK
jgi:regulator of sigma E protease